MLGKQDKFPTLLGISSPEIRDSRSCGEAPIEKPSQIHLSATAEAIRLSQWPRGAALWVLEMSVSVHSICGPVVLNKLGIER